MKTITEMTAEEIIINARDNAGTDAYSIPASKAEMARQEDVMTAYWYGRHEAEAKESKKADEDFAAALKDFGVK